MQIIIFNQIQSPLVLTTTVQTMNKHVKILQRVLAQNVDLVRPEKCRVIAMNVQVVLDNLSQAVNELFVLGHGSVAVATG